MLIAAPTPAGDVVFVYQRDDVAVVVVLSRSHAQMSVCAETYLQTGEDVVMLPGVHMLGGQYYDEDDDPGGHVYCSASDITTYRARELAFSTMTTHASMTFHAVVALATARAAPRPRSRDLHSSAGIEAGMEGLTVV